MKRIERLYCTDSSQCRPGFSCINGECIEDITPPPPDCVAPLVWNPTTNQCELPPSE